ncbi:amidohydrolase [Aminipila terrae]|uniref:Amidohydrolase family protein n=1 Tax=Aminipila terrae TaxID=2697030 RepID=A0A6P1MIE5_9FIRM|nr:amidohydrolase [Aminipila terrae]QHI72384.1 amidohydrolase family protein [Aminipila terrae]
MELDVLLKNGIIYTMEQEGKTVEALGIKDGKIVFAGSNQEANNYSSANTVDLENRAVIPGMADSHMHMYAYCQNQTTVNLEQAKSMDEMIALMKEKAEKTPEGSWIKGSNFDQTKFKENRFPTRKDLDQVSTVHPIVIRRCCLHAIVANTKALELAGVGIGYDGGPGGIVEFDEDGMPNGILREQSTKVFDEIIPDPLSDEAEKRRIFLKVLGDMSSKGVTAIHTYAAKIWRYNEDIDTYGRLDKENELPVRVTVYLDELFTPEDLTPEQKNDPFRLVQFGGYKIFSDGSLGSRSAALQEPYSDNPDNRGFVVCGQEELNDKVLKAYENGLQPAIHAIGDRALDMTLTAIEETLRITRAKGMTEDEQKQRLPFRIIHVQMINDALLERMKKLPLILDIQPVFIGTDAHWVEERIGSQRAKGAYAWKTLKDAGMIQTGGSDCPVETYDPIAGIFSAVARCDKDGKPAGGYRPEEKLSVYEAIELFTKNVHYATGQQDYLGTLEVGKFADLVVLDRNPFTIDEMELKDIKVKQTYIAGKRVF